MVNWYKYISQKGQKTFTPALRCNGYIKKKNDKCWWIKIKREFEDARVLFPEQG